MSVRGSLTVLFIVGWPSVVSAQPSARLALAWNAPPGCPSAEDVQARVEELIGNGAASGSVADVRASGQVERVDNGYRLLLNMGVGKISSARVIEARTCEELAGAAAIAIGLLARSSVESELAASPTDSPDAASPTEQPNPPPAPTPVPERREEPTHGERSAAAELRPSRLRFLLDAPVGLAGWGILPRAGLGLGAGVGLRWKALRVTVSGQLWQPETDQLAGFDARFSLQSGRAEACLTHSIHGFELGACLGASLQRLSGEGTKPRVFKARSRAASWVSPAGGVMASVQIPGFERLRLFGAGRVLVSPERPRFVIDQLGPVHQPALAAPQLDLGCEWIF